MKPPKVLVIDLPTLRMDWIETEMPRLAEISRGWTRGPVEPIFPALTCPSQATMTTGAAPREHGLVANGIFYRATGQPEFWVFHDTAIQARRVWEDYSEAGLKTGVFFFLNINEAKADAILLPKPIHHDDGSMSMWCYHKPEGFYPDLVKTMGHFNLLKFWGPMAGIDSSKWIGKATLAAFERFDLDLAFVYLPHTDYAPQKFGPNSDANRKAHRELDGVLADLIEGARAAAPETRVVIVSEYAITDVSRWFAPNRALRRAGLLAINEVNDRELLDYQACRAFAMVDHQICHVYCDPADRAVVRAAIEADPDAAAAIESIVEDPAEVGLDHERSGELILIARRDAWFTYPWWDDFARAPEFAKTMDIHNKPGYDPIEMFWDPKINGIAQDPSLIKGSHGAPARDPDQQACVLGDLEGLDTVKRLADVHALLMSRIS